MRRLRTTALTVSAAATLALTASVGAAVAADGPTMPELRGKGLMNVFETLDYRTEVRVDDVGTDHRHVLWPTNWKVCTQTPAAGREIGPDPVRIGVVKNGESCPKG